MSLCRRCGRGVGIILCSLRSDIVLQSEITTFFSKSAREFAIDAGSFFDDALTMDIGCRDVVGEDEISMFDHLSSWRDAC